MARRKSKIGVLGIGSLPLTPAVDKPRETLRSFTENYNREEEAKRQEELSRGYRNVEAELFKELRANAKRVKAFFSLDLKEMAGYPVTAAPVEYSHDYPARSGPRDANAEYAAYQTFRVELAGRGITITDNGAKRIGSYVSALAEGRGIEPTPATWENALDRLYELGCFSSGEVSNYQPRPEPVIQQPVTAQQPGLDELLRTTSAESREGRKRLVEAAEMENFKSADPIYTEWLTHLQQTYGFDVSAEDRRYILNVLFPRNNWSYTRAESYNKARRAMVAQNRWADSLLTKEEMLCREVETTPNDYHQKRGLLRRLRDVSQVTN